MDTACDRRAAGRGRIRRLSRANLCNFNSAMAVPQASLPLAARFCPCGQIHRGDVDCWFVLGILLMYISSVMRFILFDSVLAKECHIRQGWSRRQGPGWRFFSGNCSTFCSFWRLIVLVGVPAGLRLGMGWLTSPRTLVPAGARRHRSVFRVLIFFVVVGVILC